MSEKVEGRISTIVVVGGQTFKPTWVHAHNNGGFVLGFKNSQYVTTIPANQVVAVSIDYGTPEAAEALFKPKEPGNE